MPLSERHRWVLDDAVVGIEREAETIKRLADSDPDRLDLDRIRDAALHIINAVWSLRRDLT